MLLVLEENKKIDSLTFFLHEKVEREGVLNW